MEPFFSLLPTEQIVRGDEVIISHTARQCIFTCEDCGLYKGARSPKLRFSGEGRKKILVVGEQPSRKEDENGIYGFGEEYSFMEASLASLGVDLSRDCYYTTAINCIPGKTRAPAQKEIQACHARIVRLIERLQCRTVLLVGKAATESFILPRLSGRITSVPISSFMNLQIPDQEYKVWICPVWGVSELMETKNYEDGNVSKPRYLRDDAYYAIWKRALASAASKTGFTDASYLENCMVIESEEEVLKILADALTWEKVAFDYETSGLKPHRTEQHIRTVAISDGLFSYAFPFSSSPKFQASWTRLMFSDVGKIAQNLPYEMQWTRVQCGYWIKNWHWDTMLAEHCIDNKGPTSLKFMVYKYFGHTGYDDEVDAYLKPVKAESDVYGNNALNRIDSAPLPLLLKYNALDALYTFKIAELQEALLSPELMGGYKFFLESEQTLTKVTEAGFNVDMDVLTDAEGTLLRNMSAIEEDFIWKTEEYKQWQVVTGGHFNFRSPVQLGKLLYDILKVPVTFRTETGMPSVDEEALSKIDLPIVRHILAWRKLSKLSGTYLEQYKAEAWKGKIHPNFHLHRVETFRSGSNSPNIQNQPKRDKEAKNLIRSFIKPSKGNRLVEFDYGSLEVRLNAVYSQDPTLIKYILDPSTDMHRDAAADCFLLKPEEVTKAIRGDVKGQFVFAEFYGSYYEQVAIDLWETAKAHNLIGHLASKGIRNFFDFERHIEEAERILWEDRFPVHNEWRQRQWKFYQKHGYVDLLTGFRCYGPMKKNNTFNSPVQGSGFHILLWTMNQMQKKMQKLERSSIIGEIHDSCVFDAHPSEQDLIDHWYWLYGTQKVREHWPWINVPLIVEKEQSEIDGSWADMKECGPLKGD